MEISDLRFKISSDNEKEIDIYDNNEKWMVERETEGGFTNNIYISILGRGDDNRNYCELGTLYGKYFRINQILNKYASLFDIFDSIDQDTHMVYNALIDEEGYINMNYCGMKSNIFYIERFYVEEEYRNKGIGEKILDYLDDILNYSLNCEVGCYILQPSPIIKSKNNQFEVIDDDKLNRELKKRLLRFYRKCGYKRIKDTDFMYINTDYVKEKRNLHLL